MHTISHTCARILTHFMYKKDHSLQALTFTEAKAASVGRGELA